MAQKKSPKKRNTPVETKPSLKLSQLPVRIQGTVAALPSRLKQWRTADKKRKKYRSFKLQKRIKPEPRVIPSSSDLFRQSSKFMWRWRWTFLAIIAIHAVIYFLLVRGPVPEGGVQSIRDSVQSVLGQGSTSTLQGNLTTLGAVLGSSNTGGQNSVLVSAVVIIMSLVYIWAIRQLSNNKAITARDAYYQGPSALLSTMIVLLVMSLQLLPFAIASFVYSVAKSGQIFVSGAEDLSFFMVALLVGLLSFYWITSSIIALYIVTLPGMYPAQALKAAKKLVQFQRLAVFRRILILPIVLGLICFGILLTVIRFLPNQSYLALDLFQLILLPFIHVYLYKLYRSLI